MMILVTSQKVFGGVTGHKLYSITHSYQKEKKTFAFSKQQPYPAWKSTNFSHEVAFSNSSA